MLTRFLTLGILLTVLAPVAQAQYFGQNKPRYHAFDFKVLNTPKFSIYYYNEKKELIETIGQHAEQWYRMHNAILADTLVGRNPMLIYSNHADFQQTNAIFGEIGTGTGGVTEGLGNRVVFPFAFTNQQTHHVLGHELVHAFQYNMILRGDSTSMQNMGNLPLWMVEGLAEYMSIGRYDAHTALWMRDAVLNDDIPDERTINDFKYFPYRWGQAFWAYISGTYGDQVIAPLFEGTAKYGFEAASKGILKTDTKSLFAAFGRSLRTYYRPLMGIDSTGKVDRTVLRKEGGAVGREIVQEDNAGEMNISPAMSPNGKYVIFLSEKNVLSTDLYLADARTGKILRRITSITRDGHLDDLSFLESAGTWSPNSKEYAFIAFDKGRNVIVIKDVESGKTKKSISIPEVPAITNPAWSPDGKSIVFSGLVHGQTDLYSYNLKSGKVTQLTDDVYAEIHPSFDADGSHLAYATDKLSMDNGRVHGKWTMNLAVLNLETGKTGQINVFPGADNLNPAFDHEGNLYFLSDRDGFRNLYKYNITSGETTQETEFLTGITGITEYSPAISVATDRDRVIYTHYFDGKYSLYQADSEDFLHRPVDKDDVDVTAAILPAIPTDQQQVIQTNLNHMDGLPLVSVDRFSEDKYRPKLLLDYAGGSAGVGVSTGSFGAQTGLGGGVQLLFRDILGNHQVFTTLAINGDFLDFGGVVQYLNTKHRVAYGASISHIPLRAGYISGFVDIREVNGTPIEVWREEVNIIRIFQEQFSLLMQVPFSKATRVEASAGINYQFYNYRIDPYYYQILTDGSGNKYIGPYLGAGKREKIPIDEDEVYLGDFLARKGAYYDVSAALVGDKSTFGMTAPLNGYRYRLELEKNFGTYDFWSATADGRIYQYLKPVSLAFRLTHFGRYGVDDESFSPIYLGFQGFVHGYSYNQIVRRLGGGAGQNIVRDARLTEELYRTSGSKIVFSSLEVRLPFTGPERLAQIKSGFLFSDLSWFLDGGVAWDAFDDFRDGEAIPIDRIDGNGQSYVEIIYRKPRVAMSTGLSLRVNLFGALILEPYLAYPLQKDSKLLTGLNFLVPGW